MSRILISESEKIQILNLYRNDIVEKSPLQQLIECQFTSDGRYVVFEGKGYSCETGQEVPINESWSLSDILHAGADILSAGMDFVIPGSGAVIDLLNSASYFIEAQFKPDNEERDSLYIMGFVTLAFAVLPGPLQAVSVPLKRFLQGGVKKATPAVLKALNVLGKYVPEILKKFPEYIKRAFNTPLGKKTLGKNKDKIVSSFKSASDRIIKLFNKMTGRPDKIIKKGVQSGAKNVLSKGGANTMKSHFSKEIPKIINGSKLLKKLGFVSGKPYRYINKQGKGVTAVIQKIEGDKVFVKFGKGAVNQVPMNDFVKNTIGEPWGRRGYTTAVPLFIKRYSNFLLTNGEGIDETKLDKYEDLDFNQTSKESLDFLSEEVANYQGETEQYTVENNVTLVQNALILLGYLLPKYGADGKFGPETIDQLKKFQTDNKLTTSLGKIDRYTTKKLSELLKSKNLPNSVDLQNKLNTI
jgi:hypothetical protein